MATRNTHKTLYLLDGTAQMFRAYFAIRGLSTKTGLPTNAVYGFTTMLRKLLAEESPDYLAVALDLPGRVFRHDRFADYKANRPPAPEDLNAQLPYVRQVLDVLGITVVARDGFEADDMIASLVSVGRDNDVDVVVVSSDKDLLQLVGDGVTLLNPTKNVRLDPDGVEESFGVPPQSVLDVLGLMGDSVDNIPGVPGVGEKTAIDLVRRYGDIDSVIERAARFANLIDSRDAALAAIGEIEAAAAPDRPALARMAAAATGLVASVDAALEVEADDALREKLDALRHTVAATDVANLEATVGMPGKELAKRLRQVKKELKALERGTQKKAWLSIAEHADQARLSRELATLDDRVPIECKLEDLVPGPPDRERASRLFRSLEFTALAREFDDPSPGEATSIAEAAASPDVSYTTVGDPGGLAAALEACGGSERLALRVVADGDDPMRAGLVGLALSPDPARGFYLPLSHEYLGAPDPLELAAVVEVFAPLLADPERPKAAHDQKTAEHLLERHGLPVRGWAVDPMVGAFLLYPGRGSYRLEALAAEILGQSSAAYDEIAGTGAKQLRPGAVEVEKLSAWAAGQADMAGRLSAEITTRLEQGNLAELYSNIDGPLLPVLGRMEDRGVRVDVDLLAGMSAEMDVTTERLRAEIHMLAGVEFNVDSPKQLREVLFERLGLKTRRKTAKSGVASTDAQTLESLVDQHPIASRLLEYRELAKLKGTYVDALPRLVHPDTGRVHTHYDPTGAATGRLSSSDPNLQNIPTRTEAGRRIREAFVPENGSMFVASDYSQVELRILAHLAGDAELTAAFGAGEDIHRFTASRVFGVALDLVSDPMRQRAKAVNFGILYGMSETRLAREQGMKRTEARKFIQSYFERFSGVRDYIEGVREQALRDGAVRTMFGRVRYFPQLHQKVNRGIQEQALRAAVNTTIQGTAADLMKMAMLRVEHRLDQAGVAARMLLQVHDELLLEVPEAEVEAVSLLVREAMEIGDDYSLAVPLVVDQKVGRNWSTVS